MEDAAARLEEIAAEVSRCRRCDSLLSERLHPVAGAGHPHAHVMLVAPHPSVSDERQSLPAGSSLLEDVAQLLPGLANGAKASVYVTALLKCVPRDGERLRDPLESEREACWGYLSKEISTITPHFLLPVGRETSAFVLRRLIGRASASALPPSIKVVESPAFRVVPLAAPTELARLGEPERKTYCDQLRTLAGRIGL